MRNRLSPEERKARKLARKSRWYHATIEERRAKSKIYREANKERINSYRREYCHKKPEMQNIGWRDRYLKRQWGITEAQFYDLLDSQGGRCAICGTSEFNSRWPSVDHDHATGKIRGLLCHNCNTGIGYLRESPDIMYSAIGYLNKHGLFKTTGMEVDA